jgi:hypothetical protein
MLMTHPFRSYQYAGKVNDVLTVKVADDNKVIAVQLMVILPDQSTLEQGPAMFDELLLQWKYITTKENHLLAGTRIRAQAVDRPGNEAILEVIV